MQDIKINFEPVELYKVLKFEGLVASGGEAKLFISEGLVTVNGQVEMRKSKKMHSGDVIEFGGQVYLLRLAA